MNKQSVGHRREVLLVLRFALLDLRTSRHLRTAQAIADIFHNVPGQMLTDRSDQEIMLSIEARSKALQMDEYFLSWKRAAEAQL
jgi:hypothetical protein